MLATIVVNVRSGRGRGVTLADAVERALIQRGVECRRAEIGAPDADLHQACHGANALIVAGGDGSVRSMDRSRVTPQSLLAHLTHQGGEVGPLEK